MRDLRIPLFALLVGPSAASAQPAPAASSAVPSPVRIGALAGLSSGTFGGADRDLFGYGGPNRRNAVALGFYAVAPVGATAFAFRPELLYSQRGATSPVTPDGVNALVIRLNYLEVPLLVQGSVPVSGGIRAALYAGPSVAFRVGCGLGDATSGVVADAPCTDKTHDVDVGPKAVDAAGVVGGQLNLGLGGRALGIGARYTYGFTDALRNVQVRHRVFAVYGSAEWALGRFGR